MPAARDSSSVSAQSHIRLEPERVCGVAYPDCALPIEFSTLCSVARQMRSCDQSIDLPFGGQPVFEFMARFETSSFGSKVRRLGNRGATLCRLITGAAEPQRIELLHDLAHLLRPTAYTMRHRPHTANPYIPKW